MSYLNGRFWITYNGEIYNYKELRRQLKESGYRFLTECDTEVILASYAKWGVDCVGHLRGMFAFAIVDRFPENGEPAMLVVRDRLGIKPLLYFENNGTLFFASELRGLLATGLLERTVCQEALMDYLTYGAVRQPRTMVEGVKWLLPGHRLEIRRNSMKEVRYWDLHEETVASRDELKSISDADAIERTRELLEDAAKAHLVSDVPIGAFLSGGVDSAASVGFMTRASGRPVHTFSLGFEGEHSGIDERTFARESAAHLGSVHEEIVITTSDFETALPTFVASLDQPSADGFNTWLISQQCRQQITVAISGLGGDELFAGYPHFALLANMPPQSPRAAAFRYRLFRFLRERIPLGSYGLRQFMIAAMPEERLARFRTILSPRQMSLLRPDLGHAIACKLQEDYRAYLRPDADPIQQISYAEIGGYLLNTLLRDSDAMSMSHGLELRPLLLDHRLVQFAYSLPPRLKLHGDWAKYVFAKAAAPYLAPSIQSRDKMGFALPTTQWVCTSDPIRSRWAELLAGKVAQRILRPALCGQRRDLWNRPIAPAFLWSLCVLLEWLEKERFSCPVMLTPEKNS
jgi:asparagine synthase (glutamine-hydrolysing)